MYIVIVGSKKPGNKKLNQGAKKMITKLTHEIARGLREQDNNQQAYVIYLVAAIGMAKNPVFDETQEHTLVDYKWLSELQERWSDYEEGLVMRRVSVPVGERLKCDCCGKPIAKVVYVENSKKDMFAIGRQCYKRHVLKRGYRVTERQIDIEIKKAMQKKVASKGFDCTFSALQNAKEILGDTANHTKYLDTVTGLYHIVPFGFDVNDFDADLYRAFNWWEKVKKKW